MEPGIGSIERAGGKIRTILRFIQQKGSSSFFSRADERAGENPIPLSTIPVEEKSGSSASLCRWTGNQFETVYALVVPG
jgi:hypothetical protein